MAADSPTTPLMRQYHALKQQAPGALLMFHLGDFYELFFEDAEKASRALGIHTNISDSMDLIVEKRLT